MAQAPQAPQTLVSVAPAISTREAAGIVKREFPDLTRFLLSKVGKGLKVRGGEKPGTYTFYETINNSSKDIGTCTYDQSIGVKTYTGHFPKTKLNVRDTRYVNNGCLEAVTDALELDFSIGNPVTLVYNLKAEDAEKRVVPRREDAFPQLPFP